MSHRYLRRGAEHDDHRHDAERTCGHGARHRRRGQEAVSLIWSRALVKIRGELIRLSGTPQHPSGCPWFDCLAS
jgi:hypothetical protein